MSQKWEKSVKLDSRSGAKVHINSESSNKVFLIFHYRQETLNENNV